MKQDPHYPSIFILKLKNCGIHLHGWRALTTVIYVKPKKISERKSP
ncbi:hypothetical protein CPter291_3345 [Collimonas pratensis]|uniref:Uncharacterized protein n=1 Tax=Collimonas pratensis TaxID=279113 RepID=A0ABM5Z935_9BURK|nr:hypothetical protein CPter291_3345 [Collimonas pratensis]